MNTRFANYRLRKGATLVELLMFITLAGMMAGTIIPLLFNSTESRQRQDAIALVEQNGAQVLQAIVQKVRSAERILDPPMGGTGIILALQTDSGATNPTIIAMYSGSIILVQGRERRVMTSSLVGVTSFVVDNTSSAEGRESVAVAFGLRRIIRLHQPLTYDAFFDTVITLQPDDEVGEIDCGCPAPYCDVSGSGLYIWGWCNNGECVPHGDFDCLTSD